MANQLSLVRIVVAGKKGQFTDFADIMQDSRGDQQVPVQDRVSLTVIMTEVGYAQGMLQQAAHKSMMNGFGRGGLFECVDKSRILYKKHLQQFPQAVIFDGTDIFQDLRVHLVNVLVGDRQIILRPVFPVPALAQPADIQLEPSLERSDIPDDMDIIQLFKIIDAHAAGLPDLGVQGSCLVLQNQGIIGLAVPGHQCLLFPAEVYIVYIHSFF